ncbi:zinc finger protein 883-like [Chironomus tepperi]|uniref:zinc finger protein 883-like n=1 Tax=Chironomus tepperi TaxID=113505 RepID=UPI00391EF80B
MIVEFSSMIEELFFKKVRNIESALICEACKDLLVQFYIFSENVKNNNENFKENKILTKCKDYLNECEEVQCIKNNEYLMLVPKSKFKSSWRSSETLKIENMDQFNDTEFEYQIEEVEAFEPKTEVLNESSVIEENLNEIKIIDTNEIDISNDLEHSVLNLSEDEQQNEEAMDYDENTHQLIYTCNKCEFASEIQEECNHHMMLHKSSTKRYCKLFCSKCSYQFSNQAHFTAHNNGHQLFDTVAKYMNYPKCQSCNIMFVDDECYEIHVQDHNLIPIESSGFFLKFGVSLDDQKCEEDEMTFDENSPKCGHCLKAFCNDQELVKHLLIFHAKILTCPVDFRNFNNNQAFTIHMHNNHKELFPNSSFTCSVCKTEFETLYEKLSHMKNCKEKSFNCLHCQKTFSRKCHLVKHLKLVSGELNITCEVCNKVCRDKHDYKIHSRSHSSEKLFKCSLCSKSYKTSSARAAHLQTHLETFICTHCNMQFKSRRTMQKHIKNKHDKEISINSLQEIEIY